MLLDNAAYADSRGYGGCPDGHPSRPSYQHKYRDRRKGEGCVI